MMERARTIDLTTEQREALRRETYRDMIAQGLLKPLRLEYDPATQDPHLDPSIVAQLDAARPPRQTQHIDGSSDPARDPWTLAYQDNLLGPRFGFWIAPLVNNQVYELARFEAQRGEYGIVKTIWTWQELAANGTTPAGGSGTPYDPRILDRNGITIRWILRFSAAWPSVPPIAIQVLPQYIPGNAPPCLGYWDDGRFTWGTPNNGVFIAVPPGQYLRLFAHVIAGADKLAAIGGRLAGYTQPLHGPLSKLNPQKGFNW